MKNQTKMQKSLIDEMGLSDLPEEKQQALTEKMFEVLLKNIFVEAGEKLSEEDKNIFGEMISKEASPEEIEKFFKEKIPDYENMVKKVAENFREEMLKV